VSTSSAAPRRGGHLGPPWSGNRRSSRAGGIEGEKIELTDDIRAIGDVRRDVGMVFQQFNLFSTLTVLENVTLASRHVGK
jgi:ABC-type polar amino acid transport system ATPase subunit